MKNLFLLLIFSSCLLSCKKDKEHYSVDSELNPYLDLFLSEAKSHGFNFDVEKDGLIMKFSDLEDPTIGLCTYSDPILVEIDRTYWNDVTQYENCEDLRQNVVFHELSHGLLNRRHDNSTLSNTEWKSLMCGGDVVDDRSWQVNFSGERKQYYLDELFNTKTAEPSWASYGDTYNGSYTHVVDSLRLSKNYYNIDNDGNVFQISNGIYYIKINSSNNTSIPINSVSVDDDFYYELKIKGDITSNEGNCIGLFTGYDNNSNKTARNYFIVYYSSNYQQYRCTANNSLCMPTFAEVLLKNGICNFSDYTKLAIERKSDELFFYINDQLIYRNDYAADKNCTSYGIIVPGSKTISISSCAIYNNKNTSLKTTKNQEFTFGKPEPLEFSKINFIK